MQQSSYVNLERIIHPKVEETYKIFNRKYQLTYRQVECLSYLVLGYTAKEIARCIDTSPRTIESHLESIKDKLDIRLRSRLVIFYLENLAKIIH